MYAGAGCVVLGVVDMWGMAIERGCCRVVWHNQNMIHCCHCHGYHSGCILGPCCNVVCGVSGLGDRMSDVGTGMGF